MTNNLISPFGVADLDSVVSLSDLFMDPKNKGNNPIIVDNTKKKIDKVIDDSKENEKRLSNLKFKLFKDIFNNISEGNVLDEGLCSMFSNRITDILKIEPSFVFEKEFIKYFEEKYENILDKIYDLNISFRQKGFKNDNLDTKFSRLNNYKSNLEKFGTNILKINIKELKGNIKVKKNNNRMKDLKERDFLSESKISNFILSEKPSNKGFFVEKLENTKKIIVEGLDLDSLLSYYIDIKKEYISKFGNAFAIDNFLNNSLAELSNLKKINFKINGNIDELDHSLDIISFNNDSELYNISINSLLVDLKIFGFKKGIPVFDNSEIGSYINKLINDELRSYVLSSIYSMEEILIYGLKDYNIIYSNRENEAGIKAERTIEYLLAFLSKINGYDISLFKGEYLDQRKGIDLMFYYKDKKGFIKRYEFQITTGKKLNKKVNSVNKRINSNNLSGINSESELLVLSKFKDYFNSLDVYKIPFGTLHLDIPVELFNLLKNKLGKLIIR